jgi:cytochrome c oxidase cbb3-type subunit 2
MAVFLANARYRGIVAVARAEDNLKIGERVYQENCAACHGQKGDGKGPQADKLKTKPRDFTAGIYKFRSTPSGSLPLDEDIFRTISTGVRGTSMLAQLQLTNEERRAVAQYLKTFSTRFKKQNPGQPISIPARPVENKELIARGKTLYQDAGCASCHGADGTGDGSSAEGLKDSWGFPIRPADLTVKPFKSGSKPEDLYRTLSAGLDGTPMPSYAAVLSADERWALVSYVLSIAVNEKPRGMMGLVGEEVDGMRIDMRAAMAGMMGGRSGMGPGGGMMKREMNDMMRR